MTMLLSQEQELLKDSAIAFLAEEAPVAQQRRLRDEKVKQGFDDKTWQQMVEMGWPVAVLPEEHDGLAAGYLGLGSVFEAIGRNLYEITRLRVPIICTVIGEGGSGGALAIAVGDQLNMLQYSTYSVISPEGCASILWKSAEKAPEAAETLGITASRLKTLGLIDKVINEPLGGAQRDHAAMMQSMKRALAEALRDLQDAPVDELLKQRFDRLMNYGRFKDDAEA